MARALRGPVSSRVHCSIDWSVLKLEFQALNALLKETCFRMTERLSGNVVQGVGFSCGVGSAVEFHQISLHCQVPFYVHRKNDEVLLLVFEFVILHLVSIIHESK